MSVYQFERDGEVIEREFPMGRAPAFVVSGRRRFTRRISMPTIAIADNVAGRRVSFVAEDLGDRFNKYHRGDFVNGYPAFSSKHEVNEFKKRANADGVPLDYRNFRE